MSDVLDRRPAHHPPEHGHEHESDSFVVDRAYLKREAWEGLLMFFAPFTGLYPH